MPEVSYLLHAGGTVTKMAAAYADARALPPSLVPLLASSQDEVLDEMELVPYARG